MSDNQKETEMDKDIKTALTRIAEREEFYRTRGPKITADALAEAADIVEGITAPPPTPLQLSAIAALVRNALEDANKLADAVAKSEKEKVAGWGHRVGMLTAAALAAIK